MSIANEIQRLQSAKANIKTAIEGKGVTVGDGTIDTYAEKIGEIVGGNYDQGYEDGKNSVVDVAKFCDNIRFPDLNAFGESEVVLDLDNATNLDSLCSGNTINTTVEVITVNCKKELTYTNAMFNAQLAYPDTTLKRIVFNGDTKLSTHFNNAFMNRQALERIGGTPLDFTSTTNANQPFRNCSALIELRVVKETIKINFNVSYSPNLSTDTIQSIIDGLADVTGGTAQTLTLHATVGAKLTDEQKATITAKKWTLVY